MDEEYNDSIRNIINEVLDDSYIDEKNNIFGSIKIVPVIDYLSKEYIKKNQYKTKFDIGDKVKIFDYIYNGEYIITIERINDNYATEIKYNTKSDSDNKWKILYDKLKDFNNG